MVDTEPADFFRPAKRRKVYRKRADLADDDLLPNVPALASPGEPDQAPQRQDDLSSTGAEPTAEVLRHRKSILRRRGGIEFSNARAGSTQDAELARQDGQLRQQKTVALELEKVENRFARQTGQVVDVDKHMMAYIDSELAKRRQLQASDEASDLRHLSSGKDATSGADPTVHRQPATLGKLQEIDLGPDATARNIAATQAAKRRLAGELPEPVEAPVKVRLRPDGKPWRQRRRRNSEDVKRDLLVEEVMRESRSMSHSSQCERPAKLMGAVELYTEPDATATHGGDDQAADDRLAEQFRQDFFDALSARRRKTAAPAAGKGAKGAKEESSKGPKLGGSRSARAAMRELQEKEKAGKK